MPLGSGAVESRQQVSAGSLHLSVAVLHGPEGLRITYHSRDTLNPFSKQSLNVVRLSQTVLGASNFPSALSSYLITGAGTAAPYNAPGIVLNALVHYLILI